MSDLINLIVAAIIAFVTGTGGTAVVNWVLNRQGRKAEAARQVQEEEDAKRRQEKAATDRAEMLAAAQHTAQQTALESASKAYQTVADRCDRCMDELHALRAVAETLIDDFEAFMAEDTPAARLAVRQSIRSARQVM